MQETGNTAPRANRAYVLLGTLIAAYIGVYLCRKNISVAVPLLQRDWNLGKEQVGLLSSVSTIAYAAGKFLFGPVTDRMGGRRALLGSMGLVALFTGLGAFAPSLGMLIALYSMNRLAGAASWGAMVKLVPEWFDSKRMAFACGLLSLSFVVGGALALYLAGGIARWTRDSASAVLGLPALVLLALLGIVALLVPQSDAGVAPASRETTPAGFFRHAIPDLFTERKFLVVLGLSFTLTLVRETFNFWTVDFIRTEGGAEISSAMAAFLSAPFDMCGAGGIVLMGWVFGRLEPGGRQMLLGAVLAGLAGVLLLLPHLVGFGVWALAAGVGGVGFLVYGPYSLLGGVLSVEVRGKERAATVSGLVDGVGYFAGVLSGVAFGHLLAMGGYRLGFQVMAGLALAAAVLCRFLYRRSPKTIRGPRLEPARPAGAEI